MMGRPVEVDLGTNVKAYRYTTQIFTGKSFWSMTEYWIPDYQIAFNHGSCFNSENPRHNGNSKHTGKFGTLTEVAISKSLADHLAGIAKPIKVYKLGEAPRSSVGPDVISEMSNEHKNEFWELMSSKWLNAGNDTLKNLFKNYILHNELPDKIELIDLVNQYTELDALEQTSISDSLDFELMVKLDLDQWNEKPKHAPIDEPPTTLSRSANYDLKMAGIVGAVTTPILSRMSDSPAVGVAGLALSGLSLFGLSAYDRYRAPTLISARHKRADEVLFCLKCPSRIYASAM